MKTKKEVKHFIDKFKSDEAYYGDFDFVTNSQLGLIKKSPLVYEHFKTNPDLRPETKALEFGRAFHMCMLEPEKFDERVLPEPEGINKRTKAGREELAMFMLKNQDNIVLDQKSFYSLIGMRNRLFSSHECMDYLSNGVSEQVQVWKDTDSGVLCKCKADYWKDNEKTLVDIKTTQDSSFYSFKGSAYKYGYDRQSAFYGDGFKAERFIFIVIEKSAPYNIGIYECSAEFIEEGREKYKNLLSQYKEYFIDKIKDPYEHIHEGLL
tara:strand:+ start:2793 stop:3587 length:795 start_codon:yes stop_codon:yes gene_type:complete